MKKRYKIILIMSALIIFTFSSGLTYSFFHSQTKMNANDKNIAKFIFNANELENIELPLENLMPGFHESYPFSVTNVQDEKLSGVSIKYQLTIKTFHIVPLNIKLYSTNNEEDTLLLTCDESKRTNADEIICNSDEFTMEHSKEKLDNYKIDVEFPSNINDESYQGLVDYIDIDIRSWQNIGG